LKPIDISMPLAPGLPTCDVIDLSSGEELDSPKLAAAIPADAKCVLLRTRNSTTEGFRDPPSRSDYVAVAAGRYRLACLPLRLIGVEAAPARAVLLPEARA
jgi:hypothetical protein